MGIRSRLGGRRLRVHLFRGTTSGARQPGGLPRTLAISHHHGYKCRYAEREMDGQEMPPKLLVNALLPMMKA